MIISGLGRLEQMNSFCQQEWVITQQCSNSQSKFSVNKQTTFRDRSGCGLKTISPVICLFELFIFPTFAYVFGFTHVCLKIFAKWHKGLVLDLV